MRRGTVTISSLIFQSQGTVLTTLFFFVVGLSSGIFAELFMNADEKLQMANYLTQNLFSADLSSNSLAAVFFQSVANHLGLLLIVLLSGLTVIGFPGAMIAIVYKGMALGFSAALLIESMSGKGVAAIVLSMVPQNLILIPVFLTAAIIALNFASRTFSTRRQGMKKSLMSYTGPYLSIYAVLAIATLVACLIESFIAPTLLQLIG